MRIVAILLTLASVGCTHIVTAPDTPEDVTSTTELEKDGIVFVFYAYIPEGTIPAYLACESVVNTIREGSSKKPVRVTTYGSDETFAMYFDPLYHARIKRGMTTENIEAREEIDSCLNTL